MSSTSRLSDRPWCLHLVVLACAMTCAVPLLAQETPQVQEAKPSAPAGTGLLNEIGKLLKSPADLLPSLSKPEAPATQEPPAPTPAPVSPPPPRQQAAPAPPAKPQPSPAAPPAAPPPVADVAPAPAPASSRMFPGMANGREACPASAGGGPDCQAATDKLCQSKGYKSGRSISTDSAFACSARMARGEGGKACGTEYYVTSAFCQ